jgi:hypothetical protein
LPTTTNALFFSAPLKRVVGVCGFGGLCVGRKDGFHFIKMAMVLAILHNVIM